MTLVLVLAVTAAVLVAVAFSGNLFVGGWYEWQ
jgi:hypothetical protein